MALPFETSQSSVELLESLRRISQAVGSNLELESVLQRIVDAVCDHTQWQVCWINEVHANQNSVEVVARRDRLEYTTESRQRLWDMNRSPSLEALRLGEPIAMHEVSMHTEYPDYRDDALRRGAVAAVVLPFNTGDPTDVPRTLSVQSTLPLLGDDRQLPFLRTVTGMASLAVRNARQASASRMEMLQHSEALSLITFATDNLTKGASTEALCEQLEQRSDAALLVFDGAGGLRFVGRSPARFVLDDVEWRARVRDVAGPLAERVEAHTLSQAVTAQLRVDDLLALPPTHVATISRLPGSPSLGALVTIGRADSGSSVHSSLGPAIAATLLRDQIRFDVERDLNADTLAALFTPGPDDGSLARRAEAFGIDVSSPQSIVLIRGADARTRTKMRLSLTAIVQRWPGSTVHVLDSDVVVLLSGEDPESRVRELATLLPEASAGTIRVAWSGPCTSRADYPEAWGECLAALELAAKLGRRDPVNLRQFGSYRFLLSALGERDIDAYIDQTLGPVLAHDRQNGSDLLETIEAFLHCGGRLQESARQLHIHVSTLRYRLDRIRALMALDLGDENARFEVSLALRLHRLRVPEPAP